MYKFVLKRIVMLIPVIIGVTFVVFFILSVLNWIAGILLLVI